MRDAAVLAEDQIVRLGAALSSLVFFAAAWLAFDLARDHMAGLGTICGLAVAHPCGWCPATAGLALAGLAAALHAARPGAARTRAPEPAR